jgi:hypothetical protein
LALDKSVPYFQRIRLLDGGAEIVSSNQSILISGGGVTTPHAYTVDLAGVSLPGFVASDFPIGDGDSDKGAAWPILIFPHWGGHHIFDYIRFNGDRQHLKQQGEAFSYDGNLCIWRNFACGRDLAIDRASVRECFELPAGGHGWFFVDSHSAACNDAGYLREKRFFAVGFVSNNNGRLDGFIEVVDATDSMSFDDFKGAVLGKNPTLTSGIKGVYNAFSGHSIEFDTGAHQSDDNRTGIESIDGVNEPDIDAWDHASGDILAAPWKNSVVTITNPGLQNPANAPALPQTLRLDFTDRNNPRLQ